MYVALMQMLHYWLVYHSTQVATYLHGHQNEEVNSKGACVCDLWDEGGYDCWRMQNNGADHRVGEAHPLMPQGQFSIYKSCEQ